MYLPGSWQMWNILPGISVGFIKQTVRWHGIIPVISTTGNGDIIWPHSAYSLGMVLEREGIQLLDAIRDWVSPRIQRVHSDLVIRCCSVPTSDYHHKCIFFVKQIFNFRVLMILTILSSLLLPEQLPLKHVSSWVLLPSQLVWFFGGETHSLCLLRTPSPHILEHEPHCKSDLFPKMTCSCKVTKEWHLSPATPATWFTVVVAGAFAWFFATPTHEVEDVDGLFRLLDRDKKTSK